MDADQEILDETCLTQQDVTAVAFSQDEKGTGTSEAPSQSPLAPGNDAEETCGTHIADDGCACLAAIDAQPVDWLWANVVPRGMVTLLTGVAGIGKSFVAFDIAAAVTRGSRGNPDEEFEDGNVECSTAADDQQDEMGTRDQMGTGTSQTTSQSPFEGEPGTDTSGEFPVDPEDKPRTGASEASSQFPLDSDSNDNISDSDPSMIWDNFGTGVFETPSQDNVGADIPQDPSQDGTGTDTSPTPSQDKTGTGTSQTPSQSPFCTRKGDVLLVSPEFDLARVVRPRLEAAEAEVARVHILRRFQNQDPEIDNNRRSILKDELQAIEQEIKHRSASGSPLSLIVIDPFPLELFDSRYGTTQLQWFLKQLSEIAARSTTAILIVALAPQQARGNLANNLVALETAFASAWTIVADIDRPRRKFLLPIKANLNEKSPGRVFRLLNGRVQWHPSPVWLTAEQFRWDLRERSRTTLFEQEWSELSRATHWLRDLMQDAALDFKFVADAANFAGFGRSTLRRAFCGLKGISWRKPGTNSWIWKLPSQAMPDPRTPRWVKEEEWGALS